MTAIEYMLNYERALGAHKKVLEDQAKHLGITYTQLVESLVHAHMIAFYTADEEGVVHADTFVHVLETEISYLLSGMRAAGNTREEAQEVVDYLHTRLNRVVEFYYPAGAPVAAAIPDELTVIDEPKVTKKETIH